MKNITIYLAGPISGKTNYKELFDEAEFRLQNEGQVILNPAKLLEGMEAVADALGFRLILVPKSEVEP